MFRSSVTGLAGIALLSLAAGHNALAQDGRDRQPPRKADPQHQEVSTTEQRQRAQQQQQRSTQFQKQLDKQVTVVQKQAVQIDQHKRSEQSRFQKDYAQQLQQQRDHLRTESHNFANDPYVKTPHSYRYTFQGAKHTTNQYGVDMLRSAVNNGYAQGYRAGQADRQDHWKSNYLTNPAYRDANFGYTGQYIDQSEYNYYFRQGFQRGYGDGFNSRTQYGSYSNGTGSVLGDVLTGILGLVSMN